MPYVPIVPDGQHLGTSHTVDGAVKGHLFDADGNLVGHADWEWVEEPEGDGIYSTRQQDTPTPELTQEELEVIAIIAGVILAGIVTSLPYIVRFWNERALPSARAIWKRLSAPRQTKKVVTPEAEPGPPIHPARPATFVVFNTGAELAVTDPQLSMSGREWEQRFHAMVAAGSFADEQRRILTSARIADDATALPQGIDADPMTPGEFVARIKRMLEANPELLTKEATAELAKVFTPQRRPSKAPLWRKVAR
jgi:hypothetical protein